ncbi:MAG: hypothetical protein WB869_21140 [Candidatus Acidiferrales bacterium]
MIAALIFVISIAAGIQLAVFSWRAAMISFADQPMSSAVQPALAQFSNSMTVNGFRDVSAIQALCPDLASSQSTQLRHVKAYYRCVELLNSFCEAIPSCGCGAWARQEMATCARYAVVVMDQRLQSNQACFAAIRSY